MTMTQSLLNFILNLLRDSDAKAAFDANPTKALADAGLSDVCSQDVSDAMSYVAEYHPVSFVGNREYHLGDTSVSQHASSHRPEGYHPEPHASAVHQLEYVTHNYSFTDSHNTVIDKSVNQSIWNEGTLSQRFDDHSVTATDHSVAAGRDIDGNVANGDHNIVGDGTLVGNTSYLDDHSVSGSFNGNNVADHGGVAGHDNAGNVTNPHHSDIATVGSTLDSSTHDSHDTAVLGSFNDSHDQATLTTTTLDSNNTASPHTTISNSGNDQSINDGSFNSAQHFHDSFNQESAITHTDQHGLLNANVSPAITLPVENNVLHVLSDNGALI